MNNKWSEARNGDYVYFKGKIGQGSVVKTAKHGNYFMPAKIGMRIKGKKYPILNNELFIINSYKIQKVDKTSRVIKVYLTRINDSMMFAISENQLVQYFYKKEGSNLGAF
tara:strand:- start:49 stop:378 length:330 start_codon:yes stop_codon:yes gene_type:complete